MSEGRGLRVQRSIVGRTRCRQCRKRLVREPDGTLYDVDEDRLISLGKLTDFTGDGGYLEARRSDTGADCTIPVLQEAYSYALSKWLMPGLPGGHADGLGPLGSMLAQMPAGHSSGADHLAAAGPVGALISRLLPGVASSDQPRGGLTALAAGPRGRRPVVPAGRLGGAGAGRLGRSAAGAPVLEASRQPWEEWDWVEDGWRENPFRAARFDDQRSALGWWQNPLPADPDWPADGREGQCYRRVWS